MSQMAAKVLEGGGFLFGDITPDNLVTPEDFTDEHRLMKKTTKDFVAEEVVPSLEALERHDYQQATALFRQAGELGLLGMDVPADYGGIELDQLGSALITENFSTAQGFAVAHNIHIGVGTLPLVYFGSENQKQKYLPLIASGQSVASYALTEPGSGSDALSAKTTAYLNEEGTHYVLNGEKQWITNASIADVFIVFAKVDKKDFTAFIVERDFDGVSTGPEEKKMGIHSCSTATLNLEDVEVPKENAIWEIGKGHLIALNILNIARYKLALSGVGQAKRAIELAVKYANERKQFQNPIASFPLIQEKFADMAVSLYATESSVYRTTGLLDQQLSAGFDEGQREPDDMVHLLREFQIECAVNKFYASEMLDKVVDEALQIHGGYGFMSEYEIENMYRDARIDRIFEGTNEINRLNTSRALVKKMKKDQTFQEAILSNSDSNERGKFQHDELRNETNMLATAKHLFKLVFRASWQTFGDQLDEEQEILAILADIVSEIYAMESVINRTGKSLESGASDQKMLVTEVFCYESIERIVGYAKRMVSRVKGDGILEEILSTLSSLPIIDSIKKKRQIAEKLIEKEEYTV